MIDFVRIFLPTAVSLAAPLMLAAMGGYLSERSGVINIALEGKMLMAACAAALAAASSGNAAIGLLVGIAAALVMS
ncbi:MAG: ABC transporter permease, partial [Fimbriimonadaceae bacterium]|nr:ABC transporter permease [Fimbriimonadaceae bacterium]